jgi:hypothetical protein
MTLEKLAASLERMEKLRVNLKYIPFDMSEEEKREYEQLRNTEIATIEETDL